MHPSPPSPSLPFPPLPVVVMWPLAPTIHPASSGSQGWGWVLGCHLFVCASLPSLPFPPLPSPACCHDVAVSTYDPPHEQWLAGLGVGAGLSFVHAFLPSLPSPPLPVIVTWLLAPTIHPVSSGLQGWGGCWVVVRSCVPPLSPLPSRRCAIVW
jgi:hypothetical protein